MNEPIRILLADDHQIVREGLRLILESAPEFEVIGEASNGAEAVEFARREVPDIILMDLRMPGLDGLGAIQAIHSTHPSMPIVILTTYNEDDLMLRGLRAGALSYLLKSTDRETLFNTIEAAVRGETLLQPDILDRVMAQSKLEESTQAAISLTERELEILGYVAQGNRNKEIAQQLNISERTVKAHLDSIYSKLGVDSRTAAVTFALQNGWLDQGQEIN